MEKYCPVQRLLRRRRKDARPGEILSSALELFVEKGFAATRLEEIAARAGVAKGTVYLYFDSKEALFKAAVEAGMNPAIEAAEALSGDTHKSTFELLNEFVLGWWQRVGATPLGGIPKLLVAESANFPELANWFHERFITRALRAVARLIDLGIERGDFRPVDSLAAARVVFAPMFSYLLWHRAFGHFVTNLPQPEEFFRLAVETLVYGFVKREPSL